MTTRVAGADIVEEAEGEPAVTMTRPQTQSGGQVLALRGDDPAGSDDATRTVVAATKLTIPRSRRPLMARPELTARLDGDYRLALVSAPAGYGKTAVIASWAAAHRDGVAWLSCDPSDAEPTRFVCALLSAISARWPGVADDAFALLDWPGATTYDTAVAAANGLATLDAPG